MLTFLLALQIFHVAFLLLHDWIPLGPLSDTAALRAEHPAWKLLLGTSISTLPFIIALACSLHFLHHVWPHWLFIFLWIAYVFLFMGELEAWWLPWFGRRIKPERVASYDRMFGATHAFLPARNGIRINTLHVILHSATVATLLVLAILTL
jgi:hypothetical protein